MQGRAKIPEQVALRQHLGLPKGAAAGRARIRSRDFAALLSDAGVPLTSESVAKLVAIVGGPLPDVPALVRTSRQPVPYIEAERLMLSSLSQNAFRKMLAQRPQAPQAKQAAKPPLPEWNSAYMAAAAAAELAGSEGERLLATEQILMYETVPLSANREELERWWAGQFDHRAR